MLVLSRRKGESIVIDGNIELTVVRVDGDAVRIGFKAPSNVQILRSEVYEDIQLSNKVSVIKDRTNLPLRLSSGANALGSTKKVSDI